MYGKTTAREYTVACKREKPRPYRTKIVWLVVIHSSSRAIPNAIGINCYFVAGICMHVGGNLCNVPEPLELKFIFCVSLQLSLYLIITFLHSCSRRCTEHDSSFWPSDVCTCPWLMCHRSPGFGRFPWHRMGIHNLCRNTGSCRDQGSFPCRGHYTSGFSLSPAQQCPHRTWICLHFQSMVLDCCCRIQLVPCLGHRSGPIALRQYLPSRSNRPCILLLMKTLPFCDIHLIGNQDTRPECSSLVLNVPRWKMPPCTKGSSSIL